MKTCTVIPKHPMSKLNNLLAAAALTAALSTPGCADDCEVISADENSPQLSSSAEVLSYCASNKNAALACLKVDDSGDKVDCSAPVFECSTPGLQQKMEELFSTGGGQYCVEDPAQLQANL